jgi:hypothetical protein
MLKKLRVCRSEPFIKDNFISEIHCFMEFLLELVVLGEIYRERTRTQEYVNIKK